MTADTLPLDPEPGPAPRPPRLPRSGRRRRAPATPLCIHIHGEERVRWRLMEPGKPWYVAGVLRGQIYRCPACGTHRLRRGEIARAAQAQRLGAQPPAGPLPPPPQPFPWPIAGSLPGDVVYSRLHPGAMGSSLAQIEVRIARGAGPAAGTVLVDYCPRARAFLALPRTWSPRMDGDLDPQLGWTRWAEAEARCHNPDCHHGKEAPR